MGQRGYTRAACGMRSAACSGAVIQWSGPAEPGPQIRVQAPPWASRAPRIPRGRSARGADGAELIGRERELAGLAAALGQARLVTLTGPGGVGKSRLAHEIVAATYDLGAEVITVELEDVAHPSLVVGAVADVLGRYGLFVTGPDVVETLADREVLVVLDGAEDVASGVAALLTCLMATCPGVRILVTSRCPLGVAGEHVIVLEPLSVPPATAPPDEAMLSYEASRLLVRSARLAHPDLVVDEGAWRAVGQICRALGGVPLGLELVGSLAGSFTLSDLADGLLDELVGELVGQPAKAADVDADSVLEAAIAWSVGMLHPTECQLLEHLAVFAGGADAGTLLEVSRRAGGVGSMRAVVSGLTSLVGRSLVTLEAVNGPGRYGLLGPIRRQVRSGLDRSGHLQALERHHLGWCRDLTAGAEAALITGSGQAEVLERLAREQGNLRSALAFACRERDRAAVVLAKELWRFWELRGQLDEGRRWLGEAQTIATEADPLRFHLLDGAGMLAWRQGDREGAEAALAAAHDLAVGAGDRGLTARARNHLGLAALFAGDTAGAARWFEQSLSELEPLDAPGESALVAANLALVAIREGRCVEARQSLDATAAAQLALGDRHGRAISLLHRSMAGYFLDERDGARADALDAASTFADLGDDRSLAFALVSLSANLAEAHPDLALKVAGLAGALQDRVGIGLPHGWDGPVEAALAPARAMAGARAAGLLDEGRSAAPRELLLRVAAAISTAPDVAHARWVSISALGGFEVAHGDRRLHLEPQVARLVKLLVVQRPSLHVEQAMEALWPEAAPERGRRRLRNVLSRLHRAAGPLVVRRGDTLALGEGVDLDAARFEGEATRAITAFDEGAVAVGRDWARAAMASYRGDLLPEELYEPWAATARERLRRLHLRLLDTWTQAAHDGGEVHEAEACLRAAIDADPLDEDRYVRLAELLAGDDRPAAALAVLTRARVVAAELDVPVSSSVDRIERRVRGGG